jgi:hypothetical protein
MANEVIETVKRKPTRWLDGLYCSWKLEVVAFDHNVLQILARTGADRDSALAAKLGLGQKDPVFLDCIQRLSLKGCIIRRERKWHHTGHWNALEDPTIQLSAKGDFLAYQELPEQES